MKPWLLEILRCLNCRSRFELSEFAHDAVEVEAGVLRCAEPACGAWWAIRGGVPRLLPGALGVSSRQWLAGRFPREVERLGLSGVTALMGDGDPLLCLKEHTARNFGFEWTQYSRFGWDDPAYNTRKEEDVFRRKSLLEASELTGKLVLDAGCGNGRYCYWSGRHGALVVGVDLSDAVDAARANTRGTPNVQIVQGDLFDLPFAESVFDIVYSIGVLMHTGDAGRALASCSTHVRPGGSLSAHLYGRGNPIYECVDRTLRRRTTRWEVRRLERMSRSVFRWVRTLDSVRLHSLVARFIRLDLHPHCIFDWYSAPIATHHTYAEVKQWMGSCGFDVVRTNEGDARRGRLLGALRGLLGNPTTVTVRGIRRF